MYNLIVIGYSDTSWFEAGEVKLPKERYLEYTEEEVKQAFESSYIKAQNLPCLIMQEGDNPEIHLCKLNKVEPSKPNIKISFTVIQKSVFTLNQVDTKRFKIADFERYRTHWSIKNISLSNLIDSIEINNKIKQTFKDNFAKFNTIDINATHGSSLTAEFTTDYDLIKSVNDFIEKILLIENNGEYINFYRGHSNHTYKLEPSLFRKTENGNFQYLEKEQKIYNELLTNNFNEFSSDRTTFDRLVRMQHFSLPTRLLDISSNPLIGLYFACKGSNGKHGDVILVQVPETVIKYFDSDTATCIANLCKLSNKEKENLLLQDQTNIEYKNTRDKLLHYIKDDKPYFVDCIKDEDLHKVLCIKGKLTNTRINAQSGAFLLFGNDSNLQDTNDFGFNIQHFHIDKDSKSDILKQLDLLNVNESTLFPYLENTAKYISNKYKNND